MVYELNIPYDACEQPGIVSCYLSNKELFCSVLFSSVLFCKLIMNACRLLYCTVAIVYALYCFFMGFIAFWTC